jgi:hypothetical protein
VDGTNFDAQEFLQTSTLKPCSVFKAGEPRIPSRPHGPVHASSGFTVQVSDAGMADLAAQVSDACGFLKRYADEIRVLSALNSLEDI